jgi:hypothetical protein
MDSAEAARRLAVAEHEIVTVRLADGWWEALHHDMANHEENWRRVLQVHSEEPAAEPAEAAPTKPKRRARS